MTKRRAFVSRLFCAKEITLSSIITDTRPQAALVLADGTVFLGKSIGAAGSATADVVFNTAVTGYQEMLTDPSCAGQIVTLTYPHVGNTGVNVQDVESARARAAGLIVRCLSPVVSNFRATQDLSSYLKDEGIVGLSDIDTRRLTRLLRDKGTQVGTIVAAAQGDLTQEAIDAALKSAVDRAAAGSIDLVKDVTCEASYEWTQGSWQLVGPEGTPAFAERDAFDCHVVVYDLGVKRATLRQLADRGVRVTVVPANTSAEELLAQKPDGVLFSTGPGQAAACGYAIDVAKACLQARIPTFGVGLGHQIMAMAAGAKIVKTAFGRHGGNQPVVDLSTGGVAITSQNYGDVVDAESLPEGVTVTHKSLFDGSVQGLRYNDAPALSFQGYAESRPGPREVGVLLDRFVELVRAARH